MTAAVDYDDDWAWQTPAPDGVMHAMAGIDGGVPCCGADPVRMPAGDGMTSDPNRVTCPGVVT